MLAERSEVGRKRLLRDAVSLLAPLSGPGPGRNTAGRLCSRRLPGEGVPLSATWTRPWTRSRPRWPAWQRSSLSRDHFLETLRQELARHERARVISEYLPNSTRPCPGMSSSLIGMPCPNTANVGSASVPTITPMRCRWSARSTAIRSAVTVLRPRWRQPVEYCPPRGLFVVVYAGITRGLRRLPDARPRNPHAEIKKMYVRPDRQGHGLGLILSQLGSMPHALECRRHPGNRFRNAAALALYRAMGYRPCPRYAAAYRDPQINRAFSRPCGQEPRTFPFRQRSLSRTWLAVLRGPLVLNGPAPAPSPLPGVLHRLAQRAASQPRCLRTRHIHVPGRRQHAPQRNLSPFRDAGPASRCPSTREQASLPVTALHAFQQVPVSRAPGWRREVEDPVTPRSPDR